MPWPESELYTSGRDDHSATLGSHINAMCITLFLACSRPSCFSVGAPYSSHGFNLFVVRYHRLKPIAFYTMLKRNELRKSLEPITSPDKVSRPIHCVSDFPRSSTIDTEYKSVPSAYVMDIIKQLLVVVAKTDVPKWFLKVRSKMDISFAIDKGRNVSKLLFGREFLFHRCVYIYTEYKASLKLEVSQCH